MLNLKRLSAVVLGSCALLCHAAGGLADRFNDYANWLFPALAYCVGFSVLIFVILFFILRRYKTTKDRLFSQFSDYLRSHGTIAIIYCGLVLSIPLGFLINILYLICWVFLSIGLFGVLIVYPFLLNEKRFRNTTLLSTKTLQWTAVVVLSITFASILFLACSQLLPGTDMTYYAHNHRGILTSGQLYTHPIGSLIFIWEPSVIFLFEIAVALLLHWIGNACRYLYERLFAIKKQ